jgi:hypothetical protein
MGYEEITDHVCAEVRIKWGRRLGANRIVERPREGGGQGHSALGMDHSVISAHEGDPEQGPGLGGRLTRRYLAAVSRLQMPGEGNITPWDRIAEPIDKDEHRMLDDHCELCVCEP